MHYDLFCDLMHDLSSASQVTSGFWVDAERSGHFGRPYRAGEAGAH